MVFFFFLPINNLNYEMKYINKILYKNEICEYIIQILGNSSTKAKLIVTGTESFFVVVFDHCYGSVLSYRFETTNYRVSWNQTEGTEAQKQFYKMMNNLLISEMKTRIQ